jgi:hypothetical protein
MQRCFSTLTLSPFDVSSMIHSKKTNHRCSMILFVVTLTGLVAVQILPDWAEHV